MNYLLDTNLLSELMKTDPKAGVVDWIRRHESVAFLSAITLGEIDRGIALLPAGRKKADLSRAFETLLEVLDGRILAFDHLVARRWALLTATAKRKGRNLTLMDSLIEATALEWGMTLVTRNTRDFFQVSVLNPWEEK